MNEKVVKGWEILLYGMASVRMASENFANEKEYTLFLDVFNGNTPEGYAQDRYTKAFSYSFDDEECRFQHFIREGLNIEHDYIGDTCYFSSNLVKEENIVVGLFGFELMKIGLHLLDDIRKTSPKEEWDFKNYPLSDDIPNPFEIRTFSQFHQAVLGWIRAFKKELKDEIGRRSYDSKQKQAQALAEEWERETFSCETNQ